MNLSEKRRALLERLQKAVDGRMLELDTFAAESPMRFQLDGLHLTPSGYEAARNAQKNALETGPYLQLEPPESH